MQNTRKTISKPKSKNENAHHCNHYIKKQLIEINLMKNQAMTHAEVKKMQFSLRIGQTEKWDMRDSAISKKNMKIDKIFN